MSTTTTQTAGIVQMIALSEIRHDQNSRQQLAPDEVEALASSIALLGQLSPVSVRPDVETGTGFLLIAGHKRYAALEQLGHTEIRAEVRPDGGSETAERAAENLVRSPLNSYEEALAVAAMLGKGFTEDGAAKALGWPKQRVTARIKLLELPERAQQLTGQGVIPLSAVEELRQIGQVSSQLLDVLVEHVASDDGRWVARELASDPGRALGEALRHSESKVFAAYLNQLHSRVVEELRLGKKTAELLAEAEKLHKQVSEYAYGPPTIRFGELEIDQARAAGVLIELERSTPIITDRPLYRELCKQAIRRTVEDLRVRAAELAEQRKQGKAAGRPVDPEAEARREHGRRMRALAAQAHGANADLGRSLMNGLATVDPTSMDVVICRCCGASAMSLNFRSRESFEALSAVVFGVGCVLGARLSDLDQRIRAISGAPEARAPAASSHRSSGLQTGCVTRSVLGPSSGSSRRLWTKPSVPPMPLQRSSQSVTNTHDRSAGKSTSGSAPFHAIGGSLARQLSACSAPACTST